VEKKQKISISPNKSDTYSNKKGKDKISVDSKEIEAAIEDSLFKTQKFLDEYLLKQEDNYNNMIDEIQLTK